MGRSKKNKQKQENNNNNNNKRKANSDTKDNNQRGNKRQRQQRFWIEDCKDSKFPEGTAFQVEVLITRGEVTDDYRQVSQTAKAITADAKVESTTDEGKPEAKDKSTKESQKDKTPSDVDKKISADEKEVAEKEKPESPALVAKADTKEVTTDPAPGEKAGRKLGGLRVSVKRSKSAKRPIRGVSSKLSILLSIIFLSLLCLTHSTIGIQFCREFQTLAKWRLWRWRHKSVPKA
jgi:hypothetical protein